MPIDLADLAYKEAPNFLENELSKASQEVYNKMSSYVKAIHPILQLIVKLLQISMNDIDKMVKFNDLFEISKFFTERSLLPIFKFDPTFGQLNNESEIEKAKNIPKFQTVLNIIFDKLSDIVSDDIEIQDVVEAVKYIQQIALPALELKLGLSAEEILVLCRFADLFSHSGGSYVAETDNRIYTEAIGESRVNDD